MVGAPPRRTVWPRPTEGPSGPACMEAMNDVIPELEQRVRRVATRWGHEPTRLLQILRERLGIS